MTICYTLGYILDIPQRSALICPCSGIEDILTAENIGLLFLPVTTVQLLKCCLALHWFDVMLVCT